MMELAAANMVVAGETRPSSALQSAPWLNLATASPRPRIRAVW